MNPATLLADKSDNFQILLEDGERVLCRIGHHAAADGSVLAVLTAAEHPSPASLHHLAHEYGLKEELDAAWAVRPRELISDGGRTMLVLEDPGGEPLERWLGVPFETNRFLRLAIDISVAVGGLHRRGLLHKDIKPANIMVNCTDGQARLTGFGIASRVPRERQAPEPPETVAGTLAYMAPEQTGRMNRSLDSRSDLYALGVTFYRMLTGSLPFAAADPMEWVHCHIARKPPPPTERSKNIPAPVSEIIMKLLAKAAEERYQTAAGVESDLRHCLAEWKGQASVASFALGEHDAPDRLLLPEKLYGRTREIKALFASFDRIVADDTTELVLVSGYSGVGKSSVVNELHKALVPARGLFASGKFDQYKRDIPYATLGHAFQGLVRALLSQSEDELGRWRDALCEALGPNGQLIVNVVPELEFVIGKQPPVTELPPRDAQNLFQLTFRRFLGVFARKEHPLALFLDDLQWSDVATLDLLQHLVTHSEVRHLLLIGAYRDNEAGPAHPLLRTLETISAAGARIHEIKLAPLGTGDLHQLIADALYCDPKRARQLADLVQVKTGGNPFFAIQFLIALAEEGLLIFDPAASTWQWNIDRIRARSHTDNVADLMAGKLKRLSPTTQQALKQLACLGSAADIAILAMVSGMTEQVIAAALWEAVHAGFVAHQGSTCKFMHDRIQQAAYELIADEQRAEVHLRIGRVLLASMTEDELAEHLFDVANQLNRGTARLIDRDEKARVAAIDLRAGRRAKASAAYASACGYFAAGMAMLDERDWGSQYELMFGVSLERAECEFLTGNLDTAEQLVSALLPRCVSKVDQAAAYHLKILLHTVRSQNTEAVAAALTCLRLFGVDLPAHPTWEQVRVEYETIWQILDGRPIESLIDLPLMTDPELLAATQVLSVLPIPTHHTDFGLYCLHLCRLVNISIQHGTSVASARGCAWLGINLGPVFHRYGEGYRFTKLAYDLVEKHSFRASQAKIYYAMGIAAIWTQPIATAIDFNEAAFRTANETGDLSAACFSSEQSVTCMLLRNDPLDAVWRQSEAGLDFVQRVGFRDIASKIATQQRFIATMQGRTATFSTFSDAQFDEARFEAQLKADRTTVTICFYGILKLKARFLSGDYAEALEAADTVKPLLSSSTLQVPLLDYFYYTALTVAALFEKASDDQQSGWRDLLTTHREQLREWAEINPPTFGDKHVLVSAEIARLEARDADAMRLYEQAIRAARERGFVQNEGLAHELAARFFTARGFDTVAHACLREARRCYLRWGALGKVRQLDETYPDFRQPDTLAGPTSTIGSPVEHLDIATVIKVSQAVSGEIVLESLIDTLMRTAMAQAGAERALLIVSHGQEPRIGAEATISGGTVTVLQVDEAVTEPMLPKSVLHYVLRTREVVILDDAVVQSPFGVDPYISQRQARSILCLPLLNRTKLIGALYLENNLARRVFAPARIPVLKLLASQAAVALENARLYREVAEREKQQAATSEMLRIIANSPIQSMLDAVAENAARLSDANNAEIFRLEGNLLRLTASFGEIPLVISAHQGILLDRDTVAGRAACDRRTIQVRDLAAEEREYPVGSSNAKLGGHRTTLATPLLREGAPVGIILVRRMEVRPFSNEQIALIETFADQAVIAIENVRLFEAEKQRTLALARVNRELGEREAKIRRMVDSGIIGIYIWDFEGRILDANDEFLRMVNYDREDLTAGRMRWTELTPPDWLDRTNAKMDRQKSSGRFEPFEKEYTRKDGSRFPLLVGGATFEQGGDQGIAFVVDLTDQKRAEEKSRESELKLRQIIETVPGIIWSNGPDGEPTHINRGMLEYSGLQLEDFRHRGWEAFVHPADFPETAEAFYHAIQTGTSYEGVMRLRRADGEFRWHHARCEPLCDRHGRIIQWYGLAVDIEERKKAEDRLRRSEAYLADAEKLNHSGGWAVNRKGGERKIIYWSEESYRMFGLDPLQAMPTRDWFWQQVHPDDRSWLSEGTRRALREKRDYVIAFRILLPDGTIKYLESNGHHLFSTDGELLEIMGTFVDVTERKRAEDALREREAQLAEARRELRRMIDTIPIPLASYSADARRDFVNVAWKKYTGLSDEAALGTEWSVVSHPDNGATVDHKWRDALATGESYHMEERVRGADGQYRWFAVDRVAARDENGKIIKWYGTAYDIEDRKRAEDALRESEAKFRDYAETASDWFWEVGPDYKFTHLSENAFGSDAAQRIGKMCWDQALDIETEPEKWRLVWAALDAHESFRDFIYCAADGGGAPMYVKASGKPVFGSSGEFLGYRGTGTDVTAIVRGQRAEASLRTVQAELAHVSRVMTLGQLTASIAHEVNQPIGSSRNNARAALNFLDRSPPDLGEVREALGCIVADADRAGGIIDRIRDQIKKVPPRSDRFDLNWAIEEVIGLAQSTITENGVSVRTRLASGMAPVLGDRVQLQQVILNLVLNAVEAMSSVEAGQRELLISTDQSEANGILVAVRDSGPGIDPEHLELVFEAFYSTKSGMGMGLSICRSIIAAHGGRLWAAANEPRGALFRFTLPGAEAKSSMFTRFTALERRKQTSS